MPKVEINPNYCKACDLCIIACKKDVLRFGKEHNANGYITVEAIPEKECTGCIMCAVVCPEGAIEVYK